MKSIALVLFVSSLTLLAACGDDDNGTQTPDAAPNTNPDASATPDAGTTPDGAPAACTVSTADFGDLGAVTGQAILDDGTTTDDTTDDVYEFDSLLEKSAPSDGLIVQLYAGYGPFETAPIAAGTYQLTGTELDFATCGVCVRLVTNVAADGSSDGDYMATGGTVTVSEVGAAVGGTFSGTLTNVTFQHVTIDPQTGASTSVGDSCASGVTNATFTGTLMAPPTGP